MAPPYDECISAFNKERHVKFACRLQVADVWTRGAFSNKVPMHVFYACSSNSRSVKPQLHRARSKADQRGYPATCQRRTLYIPSIVHIGIIIPSAHGD